MRIVPRLTLALVGGMCLVLGANGYMRFRRESAAFEAERAYRHRRAAASMGAAMTRVWLAEGEDDAVETMNAIATGFTVMQATWIPGGEPPPNTGSFTTIDRDRAVRLTKVPIVIRGVFQGNVELTESTEGDAAHARTVLLETIATAAALVLLSALIAFALGQWVVGRPVQALAAHARQIGRGGFGPSLELSGPDELAELAREMNAMAARLQRTVEQLRHADRLATVGKLGSGVAHELGTPLNVVAARAEMLAAGQASPEEVRDYAGAIGQAAERMTRIISQLLQFARRNEVRREPRDVAALAREAADLVRPLMRKKEVTVEVDGESTEASVDSGQILQVITNLLMNALHASSEGGRIRVSVQRRSETPKTSIGGEPCDAVCVVVTDEGTGMTSEIQERIFDPFFTTKEVGAGTGLGLAVGYGIIRDHGGWIAVESSPGRGSTFTIVLPTTSDHGTAAASA